MNLRSLCPKPALGALVLALGAGAQAQTLHIEAGSQAPGIVTTAGGPPEDVLFVAGGELDRERVVKGAPYCADALHETVQTLADGNRIVQRQQTRSCRDGQGRTRQELSGNGRRSVFLRDPVAQEAWLLDVEAQRAVKLLPPPTAAADPAEAVSHKGGWWQRVVDWGGGVKQRLFGRWWKSGAPASAAAAGGGAPVAGADAPPGPVRVFIGSAGPAGEMPPGPAAGVPPPAIALHARLLAPRGPGLVTPLPPDTIEGLKAEGQRTTWTLEAGRIGNERPIVITHEVWSSPELGITLRSRDADPAFGEDSYRVQNLRRGEPDPALFRVPAEYKRVIPPHLPADRD